MTAFRVLGLLVVVLLGACDAQEPSAPKPRTQAAQSAAPAAAIPAPPAVPAVSEKPVEQVVKGADSKHQAAAVHELAPSVPVKPVVLDKSDFGVASRPLPPASGVKATNKTEASSGKSAAGKSVAKARADAKASKRKPDGPAAKDVRIGKAKLDLSLPKELVRELEPPANVVTGRRKPLLPPMFGDKGRTDESGSFELGGRLISNEMQLQMRNDTRRDVEGAALDFKFKQ